MRDGVESLGVRTAPLAEESTLLLGPKTHTHMVSCRGGRDRISSGLRPVRWDMGGAEVGSHGNGK